MAIRLRQPRQAAHAEIVVLPVQEAPPTQIEAVDARLRETVNRQIELSAEKGRDLLKEVRTHLVEISRPRLENMIEEASGMRCISLHQDVSTVTGEEVFLFTLTEAPGMRIAKNK